jgi:hypothetical protein
MSGLALVAILTEARPGHVRARVRQLIGGHAGDAQVVVLRSRRAARRYLADFARVSFC